MKIVTTIAEARSLVIQARADGKRVALVPTMGALHAGHYSLIDAARRDCDFVVVSIFVNPTQFGPAEDLSAYPRTPQADHAGCQARGVDVIFEPNVETMYHPGALTEVTVHGLTQTLCGRSRPTHFAGVCTVVAKLFHIIPAHRAYFGAKDYQQAAIIKRMTVDLDFPIEIVTCPTVRETNGLAISSRNAYLSPTQRKQAVALHDALMLAADMITTMHPPAADIIAAVVAHLAAYAPDGEIDYVQIVDPETLADVQKTGRPVVVALAVKFDRARLIDNMLVDDDFRRN